MGKVARSTSKFGLRKCTHKQDWISLLPDEILVAILSRVTLKEAATTSILCRRWRYLWTYTTGSLNFDASKTLYELGQRWKSRSVEMFNYVNWVNQVLKLHQGSSVDEFRICFDLDENYFSEVDRWVNFAIEKGVQRFELDLSNCFQFTMVSDPNYNFLSSDKFSLPFSSNTLNHLHSNRQIARPHGFAGLTSLSLKQVDVTQEVLEYFLSNCLLLESLSVDVSNCLVSLKVAGPSLNLKYLRISGCRFLENLEISAINLVSFTYFGPKISVPLNDVPLLSELSIGFEYAVYFIKEPHQHLHYFSQLETLKLDLYFLRGELFIQFPGEFPELRNLKNLELMVQSWSHIDLSHFTSLIKASPFLSRFKIQLLSEESRAQRKAMRKYRCFDRLEREATNCHQCLKVVELVGFIGHGSDAELASHLIEIAVSLEKMTINSCSPYVLGSPGEFEDNKVRRAARKRAEKLRTKLPLGAKLEII
ncbi:putative F-box protein At3g29830 [Cornus florida]|uniref:putative F-box protein At3g29830 n=1 Tax=Cornus florida TaxID=4283 RepID=UPI0028A016B3|nr:putative F-box protein At3g29830 [Cornus florida]